MRARLILACVYVACFFIRAFYSVKYHTLATILRSRMWTRQAICSVLLYLLRLVLQAEKK